MKVRTKNVIKIRGNCELSADLRNVGLSTEICILILQETSQLFAKQDLERKNMLFYTDFLKTFFIVKGFLLLLRHLVLATLKDTLAGKDKLTNLGWQCLHSYDIWCFCHVTDMSFWQIMLHHVVVMSNITESKQCNLKWLHQFKTICCFFFQLSVTKLEVKRNKTRG